MLKEFRILRMHKISISTKIKYTKEQEKKKKVYQRIQKLNWKIQFTG